MPDHFLYIFWPFKIIFVFVGIYLYFVFAEFRFIPIINILDDEDLSVIANGTTFIYKLKEPVSILETIASCTDGVNHDLQGFQIILLYYDEASSVERLRPMKRY